MLCRNQGSGGIALFALDQGRVIAERATGAIPTGGFFLFFGGRWDNGSGGNRWSINDRCTAVIQLLVHSLAVQLQTTHLGSKMLQIHHLMQ